MRTSYKEDDAIVLLKDITDKIVAKSSKEREIEIQNGKHYSELLPIEYEPTEEYLALYRKSLKDNSKMTGKALIILAEKIYKYKNGNITLVSLARAGTPIGVLLKRYFKYKYNIEVPHYSISIIRDKGIDRNAMKHILDRHSAETIQFVDGWIGKGTITDEISKCNYKGVDLNLAVLADPAGITKLYGTNEDFLIPSAILNAPVSGLFSRTVLTDNLISQNDFHGAVFYKDMIDVSYEFIDEISKYFHNNNTVLNNSVKSKTGYQEALEIKNNFNIKDINMIKPSIGETTRVLMRRIPEIVLVRDLNEVKYISHIINLCEEKNVKIIEYPLENYRACGIIKELKDI